MRIRFLGTGASGGTPGRGRSRRRESSLLVDSEVLIDVTRDFAAQQNELADHLSGVLLTHAHRDACGGLAALGRWLRARSHRPVPVYASRQTIAAVGRRFRHLDFCDFRPVADRGGLRLEGVTVTAQRVPHARERRFPTFAWRLSAAGRTVVYASDVARLTERLRCFSRRADLLVIDGDVGSSAVHAPDHRPRASAAL